MLGDEVFRGEAAGLGEFVPFGVLAAILLSEGGGGGGVRGLLAEGFGGTHRLPSWLSVPGPLETECVDIVFLLESFGSS